MSSVDLSVEIRDSKPADLEDIARIYGYEVLNGVATFETIPPTVEELKDRRQAILDAGLPYIVATSDNKVVGFASASPYRARISYQNSLENTIYVDNAVRKQGVGALLLEHLIQVCEKGRWRQMVSVIGGSDNAGSIGVHKKLGFKHVGTLEAVGYKFERWVDTVIMQRALGDGASSDPDD